MPSYSVPCECCGGGEPSDCGCPTVEGPASVAISGFSLSMFTPDIQCGSPPPSENGGTCFYGSATAGGLTAIPGASFLNSFGHPICSFEYSRYEVGEFGMPNTGFQTRIATVGVVPGGVDGYLYGRIFIQLNIAIDGGPPYCFWELRVEYFTQHDDEGNCGVEGLGFPPYRQTIWLGIKHGGNTPLGVYNRAFPSGCFSGGDGYASSLSSVTVV